MKNEFDASKFMSLADYFPDVVEKYWDFEKNKVSPNEVPFDTDEEFWFKGIYESYKMPCSYLRRTTTGTSFPEQAILYFLKLNNITVLNREKLLVDNKYFEVDILLPEYSIAIEYDGEYWHKDKLKHDKEKNVALQKANITLIRVRENKLPFTKNVFGEEIRCDLINNTYFYALSQCINNIFKILKENKGLILNNVTENAVEEKRNLIYKQYLLGFVEDNLYNSWMIKFWSPDNGIEPYLVSSSSHTKFYFKCRENLNILISPIQFEWVHSQEELRLQNKTEVEKMLARINSNCPFYNSDNCLENAFNVIPKCIELNINKIELNKNDLMKMSFSISNGSNIVLHEFQSQFFYILQNNKFINLNYEYKKSQENLYSKCGFSVHSTGFKRKNLADYERSGDWNNYYVKLWRVILKKQSELGILELRGCPKQQSVRGNYVPEGAILANTKYNFEMQTYNKIYNNAANFKALLVFNINDSYNYVFKMCILLNKTDDKISYKYEILRWKNYDELLGIKNSASNYEPNEEQAIKLIEYLEAQKEKKISLR